MRATCSDSRFAVINNNIVLYIIQNDVELCLLDIRYYNYNLLLPKFGK